MIIAIDFFVVAGVVCFGIGLARWKIEWFQLGLISFACAAADALFGAILTLLR